MEPIETKIIVISNSSRAKKGKEGSTTDSKCREIDRSNRSDKHVLVARLTVDKTYKIGLSLK